VSLLEKGVLNAAPVCLQLFGYIFEFQSQLRHPGTCSLVDFVGSLVGDQDVDIVLCEAKSPSVMRQVSDALPQEGVELKWDPGDSIIMRKVLNNVNVVFPVACNVLTRFRLHNIWL
jgi:hypothetical protein